MATFAITAQNVNGDPFPSNGKINISNSLTSLVFRDIDNRLGVPQSGEQVSLDGGNTFLNYQFLGYGNVRGDPLQRAGFVRIALGNGKFLTVAIDMNADGDNTPDLKNGNTQLRVSDLDASSSAPFPVPVCFTSGTLIRVPGGEAPVESLRPGDLVETLDNGPQPVRWIGGRRVAGGGVFAPVRFAAGALGNDRPLLVSPQHRMLVRGWLAELHFGEDEVLAAAIHLLGLAGVDRCPMTEVAYVHLLLDRHEIVFAEGAPSESFHPGSRMLDEDRALRAEIGAIFPGFWMRPPSERLRPARRVVSAREARMLAA
ncbi:Hint domain-containing protein [Albidovulum aquaemixtae]|nr:Hint domain-containing protein [Defluviimonas aquaemixtae]